MYQVSVFLQHSRSPDQEEQDKKTQQKLSEEVVKAAGQMQAQHTPDWSVYLVA